MSSTGHELIAKVLEINESILNVETTSDTMKRLGDFQDSKVTGHPDIPNKRIKAETIKEQKIIQQWLPPSIKSIDHPFEFSSSTHYSEVPSEIQNNLKSEEDAIVIGVDEAGRGPVLGPMVYGISYSLENFSHSLQKKYGFADSKVLTDEKRQDLFKLIENEEHELNKNVGWATTTMTAKDISSGMLKSRNAVGGTSYNLNEQAHDVTIELIKNVIFCQLQDFDPNKIKIFIDTVGPPASYQSKLKKIFPNVNEITVTKKADSIYPIVSTASVVAKVTRDLNIYYYTNTESIVSCGATSEVKSAREQKRDTYKNILYGQKVGSGYPSDPNTNKWMNNTDNIDRLFGWCFGFVRYSWQTTKDCLLRNNCIDIVYEEDCEEFVKKNNGYKNLIKMVKDNNVSSESMQKNKKTSKLDKSYFYSVEDSNNAIF